MTGHVTEVGKNSWKLTVNNGFKANGRRNRKFKTVKCKNRTEAKKELAKFMIEIETGEYIAPNKMTFSMFVEEWTQKYAEKHLGPSTNELYQNLLRKRILPAFGHLQMDKITPMQIIDFLYKLQSDDARADGKVGGLSSSTVEKHHRVFRSIFKRAVDWKVIKESPVENVKKPKVDSKKSKVYTEEQVLKLMEHLRGEDIKWKMIVTLAIATGMRRGEIAGLEWDHVDLDKG